MKEISQLKIAIVHDFLTKIGGAEKVLLSMHKLFPEAPIFTLVYDENGTKGVFKNCKIIGSSLNKYPSAIKKKTKFLLPFYPKAIEEFDFSEYDIVISSSNSFAHGIITSPKTFHLCYCHSPMRYVWDYTNEYLAENKIGYGLKGLFVRKTLHEIRIWDKVSSQRVDKWIANSFNVKNRIKKYYQKDSSVIYPPVPVENIEFNENVPDDYYLIVSRLEPYKKVDVAIDAFNQTGKPLVIIGTGSRSDSLKSIAKSNIEFLGWQSDKAVYEYMRNAKALIFPAEEDAGLTPIESMATGRPVIAYGKGGVTENVIESKTGLFFNEANSKSLNETISEFEKNILQFSPKTCREQALKFSEKDFKENLMKEIENGYRDYLKKMEPNVKD